MGLPGTAVALLFVARRNELGGKRLSRVSHCSSRRISQLSPDRQGDNCHRDKADSVTAREEVCCWWRCTLKSSPCSFFAHLATSLIFRAICIVDHDAIPTAPRAMRVTDRRGAGHIRDRPARHWPKTARSLPDCHAYGQELPGLSRMRWRRHRVFANIPLTSAETNPCRCFS